MKNWSERTLPQRVLLLALGGMVVLFLPVYLILSRQMGVAYYDALLLRHVQEQVVTYAGRIDGQRVEFQVSQDGVVTYLVDGRTRGPYTVVLDPSAAPDDFFTGGEVRLGEEVLFRGGWYLDGEFSFLKDETGQGQMPLFWLEGEELPQDPSPAFLLQLILKPDLRHRGQWEFYAMGTALALLTGLFVVYADRLFRWNLGWRIRNPERAEPSDWELFSRRLSWVVLSGLALTCYIIGAVTF